MIDIKYEIFEFDLYNQASKGDCFKTKTYVKAPEPMGWLRVGLFSKLERQWR